MHKVNCSFYLNEDVLRKENFILIATLINTNVIRLGYNNIFSEVVEHRNYFCKCSNWDLRKYTKYVAKNDQGSKTF